MQNKVGSKISQLTIFNRGRKELCKIIYFPSLNKIIKYKIIIDLRSVPNMILIYICKTEIFKTMLFVNQFLKQNNQSNVGRLFGIKKTGFRFYNK